MEGIKDITKFAALIMTVALIFVFPLLSLILLICLVSIKDKEFLMIIIAAIVILTLAFVTF